MLKVFISIRRYFALNELNELNDMICYAIRWYGMVWYGMVWYSVVF